MLISVPGSCPTLPIAVKTFEKGKKQLKILVKRQECPQKKPTWQQSTEEAPGISSKTFLAFWHKSLAKNLRCSSSLCPVTPLVITGAMEIFGED